MPCRHNRALACLILTPAITTAAQAQSAATYRVTFHAQWAAATHPTDFPADAHFSPMVGATHTDAVALWRHGGLASPGMESMAELGRTTRLLGEIDALAAQGFIGTPILGGPIPVSPSVRVVTFETSSDFPLLTLVTMIAPSPDWFVGTQSLTLRDAQGWNPSIEFELWPYDAGTDSGVSFESPDMDTNPKVPIALISGEFPFTGLPPLGVFTIELLAVTCPADLDGNGELDIFDFLEFQSLFDAQDPAADLDGDGSLSVFDFLAFQNAFDKGC